MKKTDKDIKCVEKTAQEILNECNELYVNGPNSLKKISNNLDCNLLCPKRKLVVTMIGNHSSGKSSFINWYIGENVLKTGVAMETDGVCCVVSGKKSSKLDAKTTVKAFPQLAFMNDEVVGASKHLSTVISKSVNNSFESLMLIDTPGLVDMDSKYHFDVNSVVERLAEISDLIFVFFDPIGQALVKRTVDVVDSLYPRYHQKMRFCLTKADTSGNDYDRRKICSQISQTLAERPNLNKLSFELQTIFIPDIEENGGEKNTNKNKMSVNGCVNQIYELNELIQDRLDEHVMDALSSYENDCELIKEKLMSEIEMIDKNITTNFRRIKKKFHFVAILLLPVFYVIFNYILMLYEKVLIDKVNLQMRTVVLSYTKWVKQLYKKIAVERFFYFCLLLIVYLVFLLSLFLKIPKKDTGMNYPKRRRSVLIKHLDSINQFHLVKIRSLYDALMHSRLKLD